MVHYSAVATTSSASFWKKMHMKFFLSVYTASCLFYAYRHRLLFSILDTVLVRPWRYFDCVIDNSGSVLSLYFNTMITTHNSLNKHSFFSEIPEKKSCDSAKLAQSHHKRKCMSIQSNVCPSSFYDDAKEND